MNVDKLEELQRSIDAQRILSLDECATLIGEVWRLKTALTAKDLEINYWRDGHDQLKLELADANESNQSLRDEVDELKSVHGLAACELENRWSNCAVRLKKRREMLHRKQGETLIAQPRIERNHSSFRRFAGLLFKNTQRQKPV